MQNYLKDRLDKPRKKNKEKKDNNFKKEKRWKNIINTYLTELYKVNSEKYYLLLPHQ